MSDDEDLKLTDTVIEDRDAGRVEIGPA